VPSSATVSGGSPRRQARQRCIVGGQRLPRFVTASTSPAASSFVSQTTKAGFAVGAGAEVRLAGNWTGKVEYLYLNFGRVSTAATNPLNSTQKRQCGRANICKVFTGDGTVEIARDLRAAGVFIVTTPNKQLNFL
jgi:outer membrane immunogenic protein